MRTLLSLDEEQLAEINESREGTAYLESAKRDLVRGAVLSEYVLLDELLSSLICRYFFGLDFIRLWRTKRFRRFNYFLMDKLSLIAKLDLVHDISAVRKEHKNYVHKLNDIRNAFAHSFFTENRRGEWTKYKDVDLFTVAGLAVLIEDSKEVEGYFFTRLWGRRKTSETAALTDGPSGAERPGT